MGWKTLDSEKNGNFLKKSKFYLDEDIEPQIENWLRGRGLNIKTYKETGLKGHPDDNQFEIARRLERMLITKDLDYWNKKFPVDKHPGVIILRSANMDDALWELSSLEVVVYPYYDTFKNTKILLNKDEIKVFFKDFETSRWKVTRYKISPNSAYVWIDD